MTLYFVRHGESVDNAAQIHQGPAAKLSPLGERQASYVAQKLQQFPIESIFSSHFIRAEQTARIINQTLHKDIVFTELLCETVQPSELQGQSYFHPETIRVRQIIYDNEHIETWRYSDEESYKDYTTRARQFFAWLAENKSDGHSLIITHGNFMRVLVGVLLFDELLTPRLLRRLSQTLNTTNTGITILNNTRDNRWRLDTWNDFAHLNELKAS